MPDPNRAWRKALQEGDEVAISRGASVRFHSIGCIARRGEKHLTVGSAKFSIHTGKKLKTPHDSTPTYIVPVTQEIRDHIRKRYLTEHIRSYSLFLDRFSLETLEEIYRLCKSQKAVLPT